jgi:hypothetical protein
MPLLTTFTLPTSSIWRVFLHRSTTFVALTVTAVHTAVVGVKTACFHVTAQQDLVRICYLSFISPSSLFTKLHGVTLHKAVISTSINAYTLFIFIEYVFF